MPKQPKKKVEGGDDKIAAAREQFQQCLDASVDNRRAALDDIRFAREGIQWPEDIRRQREIEGRPTLTINKLPAFIRQVVNDQRQNKPSIKVHPADSGADLKTAEIISGLIRNIEYMSNADIAYDTAVECAVSGGFGYVRIGLDYAYDDAFELDIKIDRVSNPFSVYEDPNSRSATSDDWDVAFVTDRLSKKQFEREYKNADKVDWDDEGWTQIQNDDAGWLTDEGVLVAEWWRREKVDRDIVMMSDGKVFGKDEIEQSAQLQALIAAGQLQVHGERTTQTCKVTQCIMSGREVLEENDWLGQWIPIVPVYGEEYDIEGKRYFRSLVHNAIDAQRMFNYWRTTSTELVALAPRTPYIGPKGAFDSDQERWNTASSRSHPYLEYDIKVDGPAGIPQRQMLDSGPAAGALQEALNASDDIKSILGVYDASLGARSNETSGRAIMARQREGDVSTFHFLDNMSRAIRQTGRILIDLIPKVYTTPRIVRVIGEDGTQTAQTINQEAQELDKKGQPVVDEKGQAVMAMHDLTAGKYDLTVTTGPSFTTRREEAAAQMTEMIRAMPQTVPVLGKHLAKNLDWPGADDIAEELEEMTSNQLPPEAEKMMEEGKQMIGKLQEENQKLKTDISVDMQKAGLEKQKAEFQAALDKQKAEHQAELDRWKAEQSASLEQWKAEQKARAEYDAGKQNAQNALQLKRMENGDVTDENAEMIMQSMLQLGEMITEQGRQTNQQIQQLAEIMAAPTELVRDAQNRAVGSRKVFQQEDRTVN